MSREMRCRVLAQTTRESVRCHDSVSESVVPSDTFRRDDRKRAGKSDLLSRNTACLTSARERLLHPGSLSRHAAGSLPSQSLEDSHARIDADTATDGSRSNPHGRRSLLRPIECAATDRATFLRYSGASASGFERHCARPQGAEVGTRAEDRLQHEDPDHRSERLENVRVRRGLGVFPRPFDLRSGNVGLWPVILEFAVYAIESPYQDHGTLVEKGRLRVRALLARAPIRSGRRG